MLLRILSSQRIHLYWCCKNRKRDSIPNGRRPIIKVAWRNMTVWSVQELSIVKLPIRLQVGDWLRLWDSTIKWAVVNPSASLWRWWRKARASSWNCLFGLSKATDGMAIFVILTGKSLPDIIMALGMPRMNMIRNWKRRMQSTSRMIWS